MKICIVEDHNQKREQISGIIKKVGGEAVEIASAASVTTARALLTSTKYDLLIIDIALPNYDQEAPELHAGMDLLDEIVTRGRYIQPDHIIGITRHSEIFEQATTKFGSELWSVIKFDNSSLEWEERLTSKLQHIMRVQNNNVEEENEFDLGIIVALKTPEHESIMNLEWNWKPISGEHDPTQFLEGSYKKQDGSIGRAVVARAGSMGMPSAAILATKIGLKFRPRVLCMTGICAGVRDETNLGDVVVANPTWDYGAGKYSTDEKTKEEIFEPSPYHHALSSRIRGILEPLEGETDVVSAIRQRFQGDKPDTITKLHIGPFATGAAVIARSQIMDWIKRQNRKLTAIDMEAHAVACAAHEMPHPIPEFLVIKGVSDFADEEKGEKERRFAAYASASVLEHIAVNAGL